MKVETCKKYLTGDNLKIVEQLLMTSVQKINVPSLRSITVNENDESVECELPSGLVLILDCNDINGILTNPRGTEYSGMSNP